MEKFYAVTDANTGEKLYEFYASGIHLYAHPLLAAFLAPISYEIGEKFILWRVSKFGLEKVSKSGMYYIALWSWSDEKVPMPIVTTQQRMEFAIRCWKESPDDKQPEILKWMDRWLDGERDVTWTVDGINCTITSAAMRKRIDFLKIAKEVMRDGNAVE